MSGHFNCVFSQFGFWRFIKTHREKERKWRKEKPKEREMAQINGFYYFSLSASRFSGTLYFTMRRKRRKKYEKIKRGRNSHKRVPNGCEYLVDEQNFTNDIEFQMKASVYRHLTWKCNKHQIKCKLRNNSHQRKFRRFICIRKKKEQQMIFTTDRRNEETQASWLAHKSTLNDKVSEMWISCQIWFLIIW